MLNLIPLLPFLLTLAPVVVKGHGQVAWVQINGGQTYPGWGLDDYYTADYKQKDQQYGQDVPTRYTLKSDRLDLAFTDIYSPQIATGSFDNGHRFDDQFPVGVLNANAGDEVTMQWDEHWPQGHPGPIGEYMAKCPNDACAKVDPTTLDWFCIAQHNYDTEKNDWPTEIMTREMGRQWKFKLPLDLPGGQYLVRHELIALHNNTGPVPGTTSSPQHYPTAAIIQLASSGTSLPTLTGKFPGIFSYDDTEWHKDIYHEGYNGRLKDWEFPGIPVYPGGYTTGVLNGRALTGGASQGAPAAAPAPPAEQPSSSSVAPEPSSSLVTPEPSSSAYHEASTSSAYSEPSSSAASEPAYTEPAYTASASTSADWSAPSSAGVPPYSGDGKQRVCRVRKSSQNQKKRAGNAHVRRSRNVRLGSRGH